MSYESINQQYSNQDIFFKLKYGFKEKNKNLTNFKKKIKEHKEYQLNNTQTPKEFMKIDIKNYIPNSFAIKVNFKLTAPYYSSDNDDFYIISNPCIKEHVFKVPMVRGSSWKGALLNGAREVIKEDNSNEIENLKSYFRIFGVGDDSFRNIVDNVNDNDFRFFFILSGLVVDINDDIKKIFEQYKESKAQKGRAIFYPTYFDKLSLEVINPHNRKTKAGTKPIHYEVVPKKSEGILQIVYIPFDGVTKSNSEIEKEAKQDLRFLIKCINRVKKRGIGAKTKLGWGRFEIEKATCIWSER